MTLLVVPDDARLSSSPPRILTPSLPLSPLAYSPRAEPIGVGFIVRTICAVVNRKFWSLFGYPSYMIFVAPEMSGPNCAVLAEHWEKGEVRAVVQDSSFTLTKDSVAAMHAKVADGRVAGKLVLVVRPGAAATS